MHCPSSYSAEALIDLSGVSENMLKLNLSARNLSPAFCVGVPFKVKVRNEKKKKRERKKEIEIDILLHRRAESREELRLFISSWDNAIKRR